jgi:hypothetical protein
LTRLLFRPTAFDDVTLSFEVEDGRATGFDFRQGPNLMRLRRV